jgi:DNA-binding MarR family transcriptional regulator
MRTPSSPHGTAAWLSVVRAYNLCDAVFSARLAKLGVKVGEHEVLGNLFTAPGITQQALATRCFVAKSHISMLLKQMEADGWVRREADPADARAKRLSLTPAGEALARKTMKVQAAVVSGMAAPLTLKELATVERLMGPVCEALEAMRAEG